MLRSLFGKPDVKQLAKKQDVKGLTRALSPKMDWEIRRDAALALGRICHIKKGKWEWVYGPPPCVKPLTDMISDENNEVSCAAIKACCMMGQAVGILAHLRTDKSISAKKRKVLEDAYDVMNFSAYTEWTQIWSLQGIPKRK